LLRLLVRFGWVVFLLALAGLIVWWVVTEMTRGSARLRMRNRWERLRKSMGMSNTLCPTCKYNNDRDCRHRNRPHATICEDYNRR